MNYLAITTCNADQWNKYGRAMARTFCRNWPAEVPLWVYTEDFDPGGELPIGRFIDLDIAAPWLSEWKAKRTLAQRGHVDGRYNYRFDAVRFSHKIAAICASTHVDVDVLIWMDADIVTHSPVTVRWLSELFPPPYDLAWLDRERKMPETGFIMFRLPGALQAIRLIEDTYRSDRVFNLPETHDSYVIGHIVQMLVSEGSIKVKSLSGNAKGWRHPFVAGPLGSCMDHLKGRRKEVGRSAKSDLMQPRIEAYWR